MTDRCPKRGKYAVPRSVWNRTLWLIRDRDRMAKAAEAFLSPGSYSLPKRVTLKGRGVYSDPVANASIKREQLLKEISIINNALEIIPPEYRKGVWYNIIRQDRYPDDACVTTYSRWKSRYIYTVAEGMGYL